MLRAPERERDMGAIELEKEEAAEERSDRRRQLMRDQRAVLHLILSWSHVFVYGRIAIEKRSCAVV